MGKTNIKTKVTVVTRQVHNPASKKEVKEKEKE